MIWFLAGSETICFILSYRIQPNTYPQCQMDLALAIMYVRALFVCTLRYGKIIPPSAV